MVVFWWACSYGATQSTTRRRLPHRMSHSVGKRVEALSKNTHSSLNIPLHLNLPRTPQISFKFMLNKISISLFREFIFVSPCLLIQIVSYVSGVQFRASPYMYIYVLLWLLEHFPSHRCCNIKEYSWDSIILPQRVECVYINAFSV